MALDRIGSGHLNSEANHQVSEAENFSDQKHKTATFSNSMYEELLNNKSLPDNAEYIKFDKKEEVTRDYVTSEPDFIFSDAKVEVSMFDKFQTSSSETRGVLLGLHGSSNKCDINQTAITKGSLDNSAETVSSVNAIFGVKQEVPDGFKEEMPGTLFVDNLTFNLTDKQEVVDEGAGKTSGQTETTSLGMGTTNNQYDACGAIKRGEIPKRPAVEIMQNSTADMCISSSVLGTSVVDRTRKNVGRRKIDGQIATAGKEGLKEKRCTKSCFTCEICGKTLSSRSTLTKHELSHTDKKTRGRASSRCQNSRDDTHTHTGENPFACEVCSKRFKSHSDQKSHVVQPADDAVPTGRGKKASGKRKHGRIHSKDKTDKGSKSDCVTQGTLPETGGHTNEENFTCEICGKSFSDGFHLSEHFRGKCIPVKKMPFICDLCDRRFSNRHHMVEHRRIHTGEKPFVCEECGKRFRQASGLTLHRRSYHEENGVRESFICDVCGRAFKTLSGMRFHTELHTIEKMYLCDVCGKAFNQKAKLARHCKSHDTAKLFECEECGNMYKTRANLKEHKVVHKGEKRFTCELCHKTFFYGSTLTAHRRSHTGERPHACKTCGKRFTQTGRLKEHERIHTGERPHVCETCGKAFRGRSDLTVHRRIHTGEKPYVCGLCDAAFIVSAGLRKHHARKHAKDISVN